MSVTVSKLDQCTWSRCIYSCSYLKPHRNDRRGRYSRNFGAGIWMGHRPLRNTRKCIF